VASILIDEDVISIVDDVRKKVISLVASQGNGFFGEKSILIGLSRVLSALSNTMR